MIGVVTSKDGPNWTDSPKSPVLTTSERPSDSWDDGMVSRCSVTTIGDPCPVHVTDEWRLYCNGRTLSPEAKNRIGAEYAIGLAFAKE